VLTSVDSASPIAVIGAGTMGRGIARVIAGAGFDVNLHDAQRDALPRALAEIDASLDREIARGSQTEDDKARVRSHLHTCEGLAEAIEGTRFVIETVPEDPDIKRDVFVALDASVDASALLATNTSAMSVTEIGAWTRRPERVVGTHFFNPAHRMRLVEIVRGIDTSEETVAEALSLCRAIGKETIVVEDRPGFATSRISSLIGNEAWHMLMEGVATAEEIDRAVKLGLGFPMGPFELGDLVGLDTRLSVLRYLHQTLGERFRPCPLLVKYVEAGRLGRKTGRGVYEYRDDVRAEP
jgi:3-hydroxybutyryl-CoA dehydrogenase